MTVANLMQLLAQYPRDLMIVMSPDESGTRFLEISEDIDELSNKLVLYPTGEVSAETMKEESDVNDID